MKIKELNKYFTWMANNSPIRSGTWDIMRQSQDISEEGILIFPQHKTRPNDISVFECYHPSKRKRKYQSS